jgi:hypothetical protein
LTPFQIGDIADVVAAAMAAEEQRCTAEQSPFGLDALDELSLHPILRGGLRAVGYGVYPEQKYPEPVRRPDNEGERCDLVLTPDDKPLAAPGWEPTLFDPPHAVALDEAFWLEVKVVGQHTTEGPNGRYATQLLTDARRDVIKLTLNADIVHSALLIVLFAEQPEIAEHDLAAWLDRCLQEGLPVASPSLRTLPIPDRVGNTTCQIGLYPVR